MNFSQPMTLTPLLALALALGWTAWRPGLLPAVAVLASAALLAWSASGAARARQRLLADKLAQLERRLEEQQSALERSEARRSAVEADLRGTEERYLLALRGSQDGLWEWDITSDAVHLSPRWKSMLGFDPQELANSRAAWRDRVHSDDAAGFDAVLARHLGGTDPRFDHEILGRAAAEIERLQALKHLAAAGPQTA